MPLLTPSRIVVLAISLTLFTFLWTFGLPRDLPQPALPIISHDDAQPAAQPAWATTTRSFLDPEKAQAQATQATQAEATQAEATVSALTSTWTESTATPHVTTRGVAHGDIHATVAESPFAPYPTAQNATGRAHANSTTAEKSCRSIPGASNIMVVVKTSKAEMHEKLPTLLETLLSCAPSFAFFSDDSAPLRNYTVHDALDDISGATKAEHAEFNDYKNGRAGPVSKDLDRWKMLPMVYKAYKLRPDARFYLFIDADTSVSWTNLVQWIARLDYRIPYYAGHAMVLGSINFAQRGPGILLSNGALRQFEKTYDELYESEWEARVGRECCGDLVLALAMSEAHVELYGANPLMESESPASIGYTQKHWCTPTVSWHNMSKGDLKELWAFEKNWTRAHGYEEPILLRDVFSGLIQPQLVDRKDEWDNQSEGTIITKPLLDDLGDEASQKWYEHDEDIRQAVTSWKNCKKICEMAGDCQQWKHTKKGEGECHLGKTIRLGKSAPSQKGEDMWTSGWVVDRVRNTTRDWECRAPAWRFNQY